MRKRALHQDSQNLSTADQDWLDLEQIAEVEFTSEDEKYTIESALKPGTEAVGGWRAAQPGKQVIRLLFDEPQSIKRIHLLFDESEQQRTQEFLLSWYAVGESLIPREIVRQQYNFSPPDNTRESEDYNVELSGVKAIELSLIPDISAGGARASLTEFRLA